MTELELYKKALLTRTQERDVLQRRLLAEYLVNEQLREKIARMEAQSAPPPKPVQDEPQKPAKNPEDTYRPVDTVY